MLNRQQPSDSRQQKVLAAVCCLLSAVYIACKDKYVPPPKPTPEQKRKAHIEQTPDDSGERTNLLNIARGAAVVSRTAEMTLENSAMRAIDGEPGSAWFSPTADPAQTLTFSFATRSRIDAIGAATITKYQAKNILFEVSLDGTHFKPLGTLTMSGPDRMVDVKPPAEALYFRASTLDGGEHVSLRSVIARGAEIEPVKPRTIAGCWSINTFPAAFTERGGSAFGWFDQRERMWFDGGFDGRVWRFVWIRGPQYGLTIFTQPPDSSRLSGLKWFEDSDPYNVWDSYFGERRPCSEPQANGPDVLRTFLQRHQFVPFYGLHFDDANRLIPDQSEAALASLANLIATTPGPLRLVSHELRGANAAADRTVSTTRLDTVRAELQRRKIDLSRVTFVALGREQFRTASWSDAMRLLQSAIELEITR